MCLKDLMKRLVTSKAEKKDDGLEMENVMSVSSRVKRFSFNEDQVQVDSNQKYGSASESSPLVDQGSSPEKMVLKRKDPEVKRSVLSVTVTTSEDDDSVSKVAGKGGEHSTKPVTDETESVVWRVRSRRKTQETSPGTKT